MAGYGPGSLGGNRNITISEIRDAVSIDPEILDQIERMDRNLEIVMERLAVLDVPDPKKLAQFKSLKDAYNKYKFVEKLCGEEG